MKTQNISELIPLNGLCYLVTYIECDTSNNNCINCKSIPKVSSTLPRNCTKDYSSCFFFSRICVLSMTSAREINPWLSSYSFNDFINPPTVIFVVQE